METNDSNRTSRYWLCPLYSFDCDCESVDLVEGIQIRPAPSKLREHIHEQTRFPNYGQWDDPSDVKWMALLPYRASANGTSNRDERIRIGLEEERRAIDLLVDLITALRLCHEGKITAGPLISSSVNHDSEWSFGGTTMWTLVSKRDSLHREPRFMLSQSDIPQLNQLLNYLDELHQSKKLGGLDTALRRFHSAYHGNLEDRIIDQMIAFESLYIGNERGIKQKLASRTASLLRESKASKDNITDEMKDAYQKRCDIVHVIKEVPREELREVIPKTEEYLRLSLRKFLLLLSCGNSLKGIRNSLEGNVPPEWSKLNS